MASNNNVWMMRMQQTSQQEESFQPFQDYLGLFNREKNINNGIHAALGDSRPSSSTTIYHQIPRSRSTSSSSAAASDDFSLIWDEFKLNGVDVEVDDSGFMPFQPTSKMNTRKLQSRLPLAKNRRTPTWCVFCKNNGESEMVYGAHILKDAEGRTSCPILRNYSCPICGVSGDGAHTIKYCPLDKDADNFPTSRTSTGKKRTFGVSARPTVQYGQSKLNLVENLNLKELIELSNP